MTSLPIYDATYSTAPLYGMPNLWVECEGIRLESNLGFAMIRDLCRALKAAGRPDGSIEFYEDGYLEPSYEFPSIYEIADRPAMSQEALEAPMARNVQPRKSDVGRPAITEVLFSALSVIAERPKANWFRLHGRVRHHLLNRGLVMVDHDTPTVSPLGEAAIQEYIAFRDGYCITDFATASAEELIHAAERIGLKTGVPIESLRHTLRFIESTIARHSLEEVESMVEQTKVKIRLGSRGSDTWKKRRALAAIVNAGRLAEVL